MTNMTSAQNVVENARETANHPMLPSQRTDDDYPGILERVFFIALLCLSLFAGAARAQVMGITKPFDPNFRFGSNNLALGPIGEAVITGNGIEYHGGPVMQGPHNVYFIWYGNFSGNSALSILCDLINGFHF